MLCSLTISCPLHLLGTHIPLPQRGAKNSRAASDTPAQGALGHQLQLQPGTPKCPTRCPGWRKRGPWPAPTWLSAPAWWAQRVREGLVRGGGRSRRGAKPWQRREKLVGACCLGQEDLPDTGAQPRDPPWAGRATSGLMWAPGSLTGTSSGPVSPSLGVDPINRLRLCFRVKGKGRY